MKQWQLDPELKNKEISQWQAKCAEVRAQYAALEKDSEDWLEIFDMQRKLITETLREVTEDNKKLRNHTKQLLTMCEAECGASAAKRGQTSLSNREILEEIERREDEMEQKIEDFSLTAQSSGLTAVLPKSSLTAALHAQLFADTLAKVKSETVEKSEDIKTRSGAQQDSADEVRSVAAKRMVGVMNSLDDQLRISEAYGDMVDIDQSFNKEQDIGILQAVLGKKGVVKLEDNGVGTAEALRLFRQLSTSADWAMYINSILDPTGLAGGRKKRRTATSEPVSMLTHVRPRVVRGARVLYSPLSTFEDRYVAVEVAERPSDIPLVYMIPSEIVSAENDFLTHCTVHSAAVAMSTEVIHMQHEVGELHKILQEATTARSKADIQYRLALQEDEAERLRIRQDLVFYGLAAVESEKTTSDEPSHDSAPLQSQQSAESSKKSGNNRKGGSNASRAAASAASTTNEDAVSEAAQSQSRTSVSSPIPEKESATTTNSKRKSGGEASGTSKRKR